ncbi:13882_t:CDS:2, partial [Acaulospora morrowiae]
RSKRALKALALRHQELPICIITHLEDNEWWQTIEELESHLFLFMAILNHLQRDVARLSDVLHAFAYFMQLYKDREDSFSKNMVQRLESRWKQWEQPLLILSFFLYPKYRNSVFNKFSKFINKDYPFDDDMFSNFNDIQEYWKFMTGATKELSILAALYIQYDETDCRYKRVSWESIFNGIDVY